ncbi:MAG: DNA polymerase IV [Fibrobacteres bacterium]|nr:DNA polymerase IV [Fibrobacterota bacterium]
MRQPYILHIDMDCFYAAVEMRDNPEIRDKPVIIGALPGSRGVISACNYEARKFGLHSAMPISRAVKLCPKGIYLRGDMDKYSEESDKIMAILHTFTDTIEQISVDEAYMEVSDLGKLFGTPEQIAVSIKKKIKEELGLTASVGGAPVRFVSKIASDLKKPDGLLIVKAEEVKDLLAPLQISRLPGLGSKGCERLHRLGIRTIGSLRKYPASGLRAAVGDGMAEELFDLANGVGYTEICTEREAKSVSREYTYQRDTNDREKLRKSLLYLTDDVARRLRASDLKARTVQLTWRTIDFNRHSRQKTMDFETNSSDILFQEVEKLFLEHLSPETYVRLIGMGTSNFNGEIESDQLSLFECKSKPDERLSRIDTAKDKIALKHGEDMLKRASFVEKNND